MEKQEFFNLVNGKTKVPRQIPVPELSQITNDNFTRNPLKNFSMRKLRTRQVYELIARSAVNSRINKFIGEDNSPEEEIMRFPRRQPPDAFYVQIVKVYGNSIPTVGIPAEWEENILTLIPRNIRLKYPHIVEQIIVETRENYIGEMHSFGVNTVLHPTVLEVEDEKPPLIHPFAYEGRTKNYDTFLRNRESFGKQYFLSHKLIKAIKAKACLELPEKFLDLSRYHKSGLLELHELKDAVATDLRKISLLISKRYYNEIVKLIARPKYLNVTSGKNFLQFLRCASKLFIQEILNRMIRTVENLVQILADPHQCPRLKLEFICAEYELVVQPGVDEIYHSYHRMVEDVGTLGQEMTPFEYWLKIKTKINYMEVKLPKWFRNEAHERLQMALEKVYQPLNSHCANIKRKFDVVCKPETEAGIVKFVANNRSFEEYCIQVKKFNGFITEANEMVANEYYAIGRLTQVKAKTTLKNKARGIVGIVVAELVRHHQEYNRSICDVFEELNTKALDVPSNAKDLFTLNEYMAYASTTLIKELEERIRRSIEMLDSLIRIATLSESHLELNRQTINWLTKIGPVFERSAILCEATKCELEDELQRRTNVLNVDVDEFFPKLIILDDMDDVNRIREYTDDIDLLMRQVEGIDEQIQWINLEERLFKFPETTFTKVDEIKETIEPFHVLVRLIYRWKRDNDVWLDGPFDYLDANVIKEKTDEYRNRFAEISKTYRAKLKADLAANKSFRFSGIVDDPDPMQQPPPLKLCFQVIKEVNDFNQYVPLAVCVCNPALVKRHWDEMSLIAGIDLVPNAGTTLRKIIGFDLMRDIDKYQVISIGANKELALQNQLAAMIDEWNPLILRTAPVANTDLRTLVESDEVEILLEEQLIKIDEMRSSYFVRPIDREVKNFRSTLMTIGKTLERWIALQNRWLDLRPVFTSRGIRSELSRESRLYETVENVLNLALKRIAKDPRVRSVAESQDFLASIVRGAEDMERISEGVRRYLVTKRLRFPRFFFLSDKEVLRTLFDVGDFTRGPQPCLTKCFRGLDRLGSDSDPDSYLLIGHDGEQIRASGCSLGSLMETGRAEDWLIQVERDMTSTLKKEVRSSCLDMEEFSKSRIAWILSFPGMVSLCASRVFWTARISAIFADPEANNLANFEKALEFQLSELVAECRKPLIRRHRRILVANIVAELHAKDTVELLIERKVTDEQNFDWKSQLRYYLEDDGIGAQVISIKMMEAEMKYGYEYLGNQETCPIVVTPLTDRCYRTLLEARSYCLFGALEGPAATGKTETVRGLARAVGVQCVIVGCSEHLDHICTGNILKGVASCGAWVCLDDFDKINLEVLSVVGQQMYAITRGIRTAAKRFELEGSSLRLDPACNICVTFHPGYAGHFTVPDNTRTLFRTVALVLPDFLRVAEVELYAGGFVNANILAFKLVTTHKLCADLLATEACYDFGMRCMKTVLRMAVHLKLRSPDEDESTLLMRSLVDVHLAKFLERDIVIFEGILRDIFPKVILPPPNYEPIVRAIRRVCEDRKLHSHETFELKAIQMFETIRARRGTIVMGETFGGKTSILQCLAAALSYLAVEKNAIFGRVTEIRTVNPKSVDIDRLFGRLDLKTRAWSDGIVPSILREFAEPDPVQSPRSCWLVFDGPVEPRWAENLNTALDDNNILSLASGEKIRLPQDSCAIIFETLDLEQASPATVSRCGMVYVETSSSGWKPFATTWLETWECNNRTFASGSLKILLEWLVDPCLEFVRGKYYGISNSYLQNELPIFNKDRSSAFYISLQTTLDNSTLNIIEMLVSDAIADSPEVSRDLEVTWTQAATVQAFTWGMGGTLCQNSIAGFEAFFSSLWCGDVDQRPVPALPTGAVDVLLPSEGSIRDFFYTFKGRGVWKHWTDILKSEKLVETRFLSQMIVPTIDTIKYASIFNRHVNHRKQFLVCGEPATGKTICVRDLLRNGPKRSSHLSNFITFTQKTTSAEAQELIVSRLNKKKRGHYGPPDGKFCVTFVDDINAPFEEENGARPALELLRQFFDHKHWYDLEEPDKVYIQDTIFVAAMTVPNPGRKESVPPPRFLRHFNVYAVPALSRDTLFRIFSNVCLSGLKRNGFNPDVMGVVHNLVNATLDVWSAALTGLRPTPEKSHYLFNVRDISRTIAGCVLIRKESADSKLIFVRLWVHEILRVFRDRLVRHDDANWLLAKIKESVKVFFKDQSFETAFDHLPRHNDQIDSESLDGLLFANFMDAETNIENRRYEEISSVENLKKRIINYLAEYNETNAKQMDILPFRRALDHLVRLCRILAIPGESILFVAVDGSGRRSLTRLAGHAMRQAVYEPAAGTFRDSKTWRINLAKALKSSAATGKDFVFLTTDRQMKDEHLLDVDSLLNTGEIPNLFTADERQEIIETVRLAAQDGDRNLELSGVAVMEYFVNRCKERLHFVLCFSITGPAFRRSLFTYPSLRNCSVNWFYGWPEAALEEVATKYTTTAKLPEDVKAKCATACRYFHNSVNEMGEKYEKLSGRLTYVTVPRFLHLVRSFAEHTARKQESITTARNRYVAGLEKLQFAAGQVARMKTTLTALRPQLELSAKETIATMTEIENENVSVERATVLVKREEEVANKKAEIAGALKTECEADLAVAIPILEDAIAALNTLKPADITLVKAMKNPPDTVKLVMAAVCVMLNVSPDRSMDPVTGKKTTDYWGPSKRVLGDMNFLQNLKDYDKDNIPVALMNVVKKTYMTDKSFMPNIVAKASSAAEGLCKWVRAMVSYDDVAKVVAPKKEKLVAAQKECDETEAFLNEKRKTLADLNAKLAVLNGSLRATLAKKMDLEKQVASCTEKLIKAENLISSLGGEKKRWLRNAERLERFHDNLAGDVLLSCGIIAYLGPFSAACRLEILNKWRNHVSAARIPCSDEFNFVEVLGSEIKISAWNVHGLSKDAYSTENAVIQDNSKMWSLLIDPQSQANNWIRGVEAPNGLRVIKLSDARYMEILEHSIEAGKPVLLENIEEELDPSLDPILTKDVHEIEGVTFLAIASKTLKYSDQFRFYITTKLPNPRYPPYIFNLVSVIDFSLTNEGLESQLLDIVVAKERPDLQEKLENLLVQSAANKKNLKQEEDNILITLSTSTTNILEDDNAIRLLDSSKHLAISIVKKQEASNATESHIDTFRQRYRPFAAHSAAMYRTLAGLPLVNPMYRFSLEWFIHLYVRSIETSNRSIVLQKRLDYLRNAFTNNLYESVSRGLFERDKLLYSLILYVKILLDAKDISDEEINFFLTGDSNIDIVSNVATSELPKANCEWLVDTSWNAICRASEILASFKDFPSSFCANSSAWKFYYDLENPEEFPIPSPWDEKLTPFQQLILTRILRPDRLVINVAKFVRLGMGEKFASPPFFDVSKSYVESNCLVPLIFLLSPGFDPTSSVVKLAGELGFSARFVSLSLGQGQENQAKSVIKRGQRKGWWIFLQNCHLAGNWLPVLERICESFDASNTSLDFRLWLSSYPTREFPITILQRGVKMTNEPSTDLKRNLTSRYNTRPVSSREYFEGCPGKNKIFTKLLYGLCMFHAVLQGRASFLYRGWNLTYNFDDSDFQMAARRLQIFINNHDPIPFGALVYVLAEIHYGGRVPDDEDKRCLAAILEEFCNPKMIVGNNFNFASSTTYKLPRKCEFRDYVGQVLTVPDHPSPEIIGLHGNASIVRGSNDTRVFLDAMVLAHSQGKYSRSNDIVPVLISNVCEKLPPIFNVETARTKHAASYDHPLRAILYQEMKRYNVLIEEMTRSTDILENAIQGRVKWTLSLEEFSQEVSLGRVPSCWIRASPYNPPSMSLCVFVDDLQRRVEFLNVWLEEREPYAYWLGAISSATAFLAAARQTFARSNCLTLDEVQFTFDVLRVDQPRDLSPSKSNGEILISDLFLSGARWEPHRMMLVESFPKILWDRMPLLRYRPVEVIEEMRSNKYDCPLYASIIKNTAFDSMNRLKGYLLNVELDTDKPLKHWIRRRVILYCQRDE
ncbi:dynein axonemal heavy chain 7-like [Athalia rosae]|uniref:dynein axonemal heavy chain 7-like n=1 Tax=Athalia rosae TaxID=37344 RepID=UPI002033E81A|nr:dynein axonemal heavy chain 7-like [Athalia rosae]